MDILTHTLSGFAVGTVLASYSSGSWRAKSSILLFSGLGGALPDIDAISMWSKFDAAFGRLFGLTSSGKVIYSAKYWYSHHGFMHSLSAAIGIAVCIGFLCWLFSSKSKLSSLKDAFYTRRLLLLGFIFGFVIHLLEDMITPAGPWGGVRLFFPSEVYIGGTGDIWWWNNYNLFLIVAAVLFVNIGLLLFSMFKKNKLWKYTTSVFLIGYICFMWQVKQINYTFNRMEYSECERKSKEIQKEILGDKLYWRMETFDCTLRFPF